MTKDEALVQLHGSLKELLPIQKAMLEAKTEKEKIKALISYRKLLNSLPLEEFYENL